MKYIKSYSNNSEYEAAKTKKYPHVGYIEDTKEVKYVNEKTDYSQDYLTFEALESGTFTFNALSPSYEISYSTDSGDHWVSIASNTPTPTIQAGNTVMFKCVPTSLNSDGVGKFSSTGKFNAMGNPYSMFAGDNFANITTSIGRSYALRYLFSNCNTIISAKKLALPATTLSERCYDSMFNGCTSLVEAPELPATTLGNICYQGMFASCTSLTTAPALPAVTLKHASYMRMFEGCASLTSTPALPATTLANYCYQGMFKGCTSLTTAPELPATTLTNNCYESMFAGCTSLTEAPALPAATLVGNCYISMFSGCTSLTTAPALPATTMAQSCYNGMFAGCASLTAAPELPATTLAQNCYESMFAGCSSLTTAPELPATTSPASCYKRMFSGCTSLVTAPELPATSLAAYSYEEMFYHCSSLNYVKTLATDFSPYSCINNWLSGVSSSGTFVKHPNVTLPSGASGIPRGWTVEDVTD